MAAPESPNPDQFAHALPQHFDAAWYVGYYGVIVPPNADPVEVAIQHYLSVGARFSFSPSRAFDELAYRTVHRDVDSHVAAGQLVSGFQHYLFFGKSEGRSALPLIDVSRPGASHHPMYSDAARAVRSTFNSEWYLKTYPDVAELITEGTTATALMHYLTDGMREARSPNEWFDEAWYLAYYPDIAAAKQRGVVPSGFLHFVTSGRSEGRFSKADATRELEQKYPGLTRPVGVERLSELESKLVHPAFSLVRKGPRRLNILVPTLDKNIMFGGYIALLNFMAFMQARGWQIRVLVFEDAGLNLAIARLQFAGDRRVARMFESVEVLNVTGNKSVPEISPADRFLAYSMWMAHPADFLARQIGRRFAFFLQEYEPVFHAHDSWRALGASAYLKPHFAIFNSPMLRDYFRSRRYGVYAQSVEQGDAASVAFEHALSVGRVPTVEELDHDGEKRLLFYARPEMHAARNLFELGVLALRRAVAEGSFGREWCFDGIGTLGCEQRVDLGHGQFLHLRPKLDLGDYGAALRRYDVGLSLMYAPHPSVVPFEMAASGLITVTNVYENRDERSLQAISSNILPSVLTIEHLAEALKMAATKASNLPARVSGATRPWICDWQSSFSEEILNAIEKEFA